MSGASLQSSVPVRLISRLRPEEGLLVIGFIVYFRNTGAQGQRSIGQIFGHDWGSWAVWMPFVLSGVALALGIPVYKRQKRHMTEPGSVPPYPETKA